MKRCPQCEFIYEDYQNLCDMDGQELVHDQAIAVIQPANTPQVSTKAKASSLSGIALPASVGLLLAAFFSVGYLSSSSTDSSQAKTEAVAAQPAVASAQTNLPADQNPIAWAEATGGVSGMEDPLTNSEDPDDSSKTALAPTVAKASESRLASNDKRLNVARSLPPLPRLQPLERLPKARPLELKPDSGSPARPPATNVQPKAKTGPASTEKKDSKVSSFLKKTGRVLSKPFRF